MDLFKTKQQIVLEAKKDGCSQCVERDPHALDFHHKDPKRKITAVSAMVKLHKYSTQQLRDEISKCMVLCSNCHRKVEREKVEEARAARARECASNLGARLKLAEEGMGGFLRDATLRERLEKELRSKTKHSGDCRLWTGAFSGNLPVACIAGRHFSGAHASFALDRGFFPGGQLDRTCSNFACINPDHLSPRKSQETMTLAEKLSEIDSILSDETRRLELNARFARFIALRDDHWTWTGGRIKSLAHFCVLGHPILAKRVALGLILGRLPQRVRETCGESECLNPGHLAERTRA